MNSKKQPLNEITPQLSILDKYLIAILVTNNFVDQYTSPKHPDADKTQHKKLLRLLKREYARSSKDHANHKNYEDLSVDGHVSIKSNYKTLSIVVSIINYEYFEVKFFDNNVLVKTDTDDLKIGMIISDAKPTTSEKFESFLSTFNNATTATSDDIFKLLSHFEYALVHQYFSTVKFDTSAFESSIFEILEYSWNPKFKSPYTIEVLYKDTAWYYDLANKTLSLQDTNTDICINLLNKTIDRTDDMTTVDIAEHTSYYIGHHYMTTEQAYSVVIDILNALVAETLINIFTPVFFHNTLALNAKNGQ